MRLQQDDAAPLFATTVRTFLSDRYHEKWIVRGGPVNLPPSLADKISKDFLMLFYTATNNQEYIEIVPQF